MKIRAALLAALFGSGIALAAPTIHIPVARADVDSFLTDLDANGFSNSDGNEAQIAIGQNICAQVAGGASPTEAARDLWHHSQMNQDQSTQFVAIAISDLCPQVAPAVPPTT